MTGMQERSLFQDIVAYLHILSLQPKAGTRLNRFVNKNAVRSFFYILKGNYGIRSFGNHTAGRDLKRFT